MSRVVHLVFLLVIALLVRGVAVAGPLPVPAPCEMGIAMTHVAAHNGSAHAAASSGACQIACDLALAPALATHAGMNAVTARHVWVAVAHFVVAIEAVAPDHPPPIA